MSRIARIFLSSGHNFFGRHGLDALDHLATPVDHAECFAGRGLLGDRFFDHKPDYPGQISFFDLGVFRELLARLGLPENTSPALVRRNAFTEGVDLNSLMGRAFSIAGVRFLGVCECSPCHWMDEVLAPGAEDFLKGRGGLRCKILSDGVIREGDAFDPPPVFAGVVLAGGSSSRMGEDKAFLRIDGEPLVARQARLLREAGCNTVFISGRPGVEYAGATVVHDKTGEGPAAGILAAAEACDPTITHLLTLPVDLPKMSADILREITASCVSGYGIYALSESGPEPLVAAIPREALAVFLTLVEAGELSPIRIYRSIECAGRMAAKKPNSREGGAFTNWNTPEDRDAPGAPRHHPSG